MIYQTNSIICVWNIDLFHGSKTQIKEKQLGKQPKRTEYKWIIGKISS